MATATTPRAQKRKKAPEVSPAAITRHAKGAAKDPLLVGRQNVSEEAVANHVESFNNFLETGLSEIVRSLPPCLLEPSEQHAGSDEMSIKFTELELTKPTNAYQGQGDGVMDMDVRSRQLPSHCRLGHTTYAGELKGKLAVSFGRGNARSSIELDVSLGHLPVMVRSKACHLHGMGPKELVQAKEDETEFGGYFILNGLERVIRMLLMPRANYPMALIRPSYKSRGKLYTPYATLMRSMRPDGTTQTNCLHYCSDGSVFLRFSHSKEEWLIPFVLAAKCIYDVTDTLLIELLSGGASASINLQERALVLVQQQSAQQPIASRLHACRQLGKTFRIIVGSLAPRSYTDEQVGEMIVEKFFLVHCEDPWQKLQALIMMYQKLIAIVRGEIEADNQDAFSSHELLLPGQLYGMVVKESLDVMLTKIRAIILKLTRKNEKGNSRHKFSDFMEDQGMFKRIVDGCADIGRRVGNFLATGNVTSRSGMDLMQVSGYTIVADKLNAARFSSHFVAVHRGQYFSEMKTTTVRKLLPETWGFLCPVHTPDGAPCGLLNHLAHSCKGVVRPPAANAASSIIALLASLGAEVGGGSLETVYAAGAGVTCAWVSIDGRPVGHVSFERLEEVAEALRAYKVAGKMGVPKDAEIVCITRAWKHLFPGLFIFLGTSRVIRPVRCLRTGKVEWIGPIEQMFLNVSALRAERIASDRALCDGSEGAGKNAEWPEQHPVAFSHEELRPTEIFSVLAALTPFSNHNQSPRNMYQCQMLKQTMGTPYHNHAYREDNKVYKIWCPQKPIVRTEMYNSAELDRYPQGTNALIAVITYTGYDMEDAMIINKGSYERGFGHGVVYKTKIVEAADKSVPEADQKNCIFSNVTKDGRRICADVDEDGNFRLEDDGLPRIGTWLQKGHPLYCVVRHDGESHVDRYKDEEPAYVENVTKICGTTRAKDSSRPDGAKIAIKLRLTRKPIVGDKFSSRHGQKGVMSILWPAEDMPFSDSGITPDILFNPHGFPSRMTIGMLIECIAAKTAAAEGRSQADATTFRDYTGRYTDGDNEGDPFLQRAGDAGHDAERTAVPDGASPAAEYFGETLAKHGFQRLGTERMYSGVHGTEMETEIFLGVVYYQRLRHMVAEKAQVRARGGLDKLTMQPVKGRKRHGGIRFGEMERDSLLAHGTAFLLHDRLMRCSDYDIGFVCPKCGSVLTPQANAHLRDGSTIKKPRAGGPWTCPPCTQRTGEVVYCNPMPVPWVFRYLACEMAGMNVKMKLELKDRGAEASQHPPNFPADAASGSSGARSVPAAAPARAAAVRRAPAPVPEEDDDDDEDDAAAMGQVGEDSGSTDDSDDDEDE